VPGLQPVQPGGEGCWYASVLMQIPDPLGEGGGFPVGVLGPLADGCFGQAAVDADHVTGVAGGAPFGEPQPQVVGASSLLGGGPGVVVALLVEQHADQGRVGVAAVPCGACA
jgi:hypothetical protein